MRNEENRVTFLGMPTAPKANIFEAGSEEYYEMLQPHDKWQQTDLVEPGEVGPGCHLKCAFCNQQSFDMSESKEKLASYISLFIDGGISLNSRLMVGRKVERQIDAETLADEYFSRPYYSKDNWLLLENFNDPGVNWKKTCDLAEIICNSGHTGPVTMITKMGIPDKYADKLGELRNNGLRLNVVVSYSGLPLEIEPAPVKPRIETLRKLNERDIPTTVSIRPLIRGINLNDETIKKIINDTKDYTYQYIAGGLFVFDDWTPDVFRSLGYPLDPLYLDVNYSSAKVVDEVLYKRVQRVAQENGQDIVVMPHTTCAIARTMTMRYATPTADRIAHWVDHGDFPTDFTDCSTCPSAQKAVCASVNYEKGIQSAEAALRKIGYSSILTASTTHKGYVLVPGQKLTYGELALAREVSGMYVNNFPSQDQIEKVLTAEALNLTANEVKADYFTVGEEWIIVIPPNIDGKTNRHLERIVRSKSLARVKLVDANISDTALLETLASQLFDQPLLQQEFCSKYSSLLHG